MYYHVYIIFNNNIIKISHDKIKIMNIFSEKISLNKQEEIKNFIIANFDVTLNSKQYAFWEIKNKDFTATFYNSGKFVIQGKNIETLFDKLTANFMEIQEKGKFKSEKESKSDMPVLTMPYIGTDESGKGDFFGPLVIAGVMLDEKNLKLFEKAGIKDSKKLKDNDILKMSQLIQKSSIFSIVAISNAKYNELYIKFRNLNKLLAWGHARVIENILEKKHCDYALSDKFGDEKLIQNALMKNGQTIKLEQRIKAESDIAVAAASILARATFVQRMDDMESFYGCKFPKGCNDNVKKYAKEFIHQFGKNRLHEVCKAHFKTYHELCIK